MIRSAKFIEFPAEFNPYPGNDYDPAPVFKRQFSLDKIPEKAELSFCGLGLGYVYLNGEPVTPDLFTAPVSDYRKTLWYNTYDVRRLLLEGENELCAIVGNGFYNESLKTGWDFDKADWRGNPKLLLSLEMDGETILSDQSWVTSLDTTPVIYNQLRSGETYDCRKGEKFRLFGTEGYLPVKLSEDPPKGILRECLCQPVREFQRYTPVATFKNAKGRTVYDFGQNISGYLDITLSGRAGDTVTLRHGERIFEDGTLDHREMDGYPFHQGHEFQINKIILSGGVDTPVIRFTYHGFRFVEIEGECEIIKIKSVFVHQAVDKVSSFNCSNELLNRISRCSDISVWSNMFYALTDCPTREKLGWTNDATASAEQILMNFDSIPFFEKWLWDIFDSVLEDGNLPSIVPSWGWGPEECTGVLCTGIIFDLPFMMYRASGNEGYIRAAYPFMVRHLDWLLSQFTSDGLLAVMLGDWNGGGDFVSHTPVKFVDTALTLKYAGLTLKAEEILNESCHRTEIIYSALYERFFSLFYDNKSHRSTINTQTAVSMLIYLKKDGFSEDLAAQLAELVAEKDNHLDCGMVGLQYLVPALDMIGRSDLVYKIMTAKGYPSYSLWMEDGATTLYEMWNMKKSANHHMNSSAVAWFMKRLVGLEQKKGFVGYKNLTIRPYFPEDMTFCEGNIRTAAARWERKGEDIVYTLTLKKGVTAEIIPPKGYTADRTEVTASEPTEIIFNKL